MVDNRRHATGKLAVLVGEEQGRLAELVSRILLRVEGGHLIGIYFRYEILVSFVELVGKVNKPAEVPSAADLFDSNCHMGLHNFSTECKFSIFVIIFRE